MNSQGRTLAKRVGLTILGLPPLLVLPAAAVYRENHRPKLPRDYTLQDLKGKTVVATGASSGIGKCAVDQLRRMGATVVSGSRSEGNLDLSDLSSVHQFSRSIQNCDIILASAAEILCSDNELSEFSVDGFDKAFATNHIGLQALLMNVERLNLKPSRVVIVGSKLERNGLVDPNIVKNSNGKRLNDRPEGESSAVKHYGDTKLCNQLLATALAERWPDTKVFSVSPGMVDTGLWRNFPVWFRLLTWPIRRIGLRSPDDAALGVVYACASEEAGNERSGSFFVDGRVEVPSETSRDIQKARTLWEVVEWLIQNQHPT